jgi:hypothetical protein
MLNVGQRKLVLILMAVLFLGSAALSEVIRPGHEEYINRGQIVDSALYNQSVDNKHALKNSGFEGILPAVLGIREVLASLMWIRADDYFHRGEYRPIIALVRQITAIDPHQLDVYATGAWHMAYNFMDKRLIEDGVDFLEQGTRNNPTVYDLFFELGYMHYDKTKRYPEAVRAYTDSSTKGTTAGKPVPPSYVRHQLAHAKEKMGDIDACLAQWETNLEVGRQLVAEEGKKHGPAGPNVDAARHNLYMTARRRNERLAALALRAGDRPEAVRLWQANQKLAEDWMAETPSDAVQGDLNVAKSRIAAISSGRFPTPKPHHVDLKYTITRLAPRLLEIKGSINVLDLSRINIRFSDRDYEERAARGFDFKMANCSLEWDNTSIRGNKFRWELKLNQDPADMGRDPAEIYPLKADEYEVRFTYNPRTQAAFIQDVYGWNGEGLTSRPDYLKEDHELAGVVNGKRYPLRVVTTSVILQRDDLVGQGRKVLASTE